MDEWRCKRCGSPRWVQVSVTGPVVLGGKAVAQCVPCGYIQDRPVESPGRGKVEQRSCDGGGETRQKNLGIGVD